MNMENPAGKSGEASSVEEATEKIINTFIQHSPEYQKRNFTQEEVREAARRLSNSEVTGSDTEVAKRALDAYLAARRASQMQPVINETDEVTSVRKMGDAR